jgi:hypothetical protein
VDNFLKGRKLHVNKKYGNVPSYTGHGWRRVDCSKKTALENNEQKNKTTNVRGGGGGGL